MLTLIEIGKTLKVHGVQGAIKIFIASHYINDFEKKVNFLFIDEVPYQIVEKEIVADDHAIVLLDDITTKDAAQRLSNKTIKVDAKNIQEKNPTKELLALVGYTLKDKTSKTNIIIQDIIEYPSQLMIKSTHNNNEILLPLHPDFVQSINHKTKTIVVTLPEGIIDLQL
ncbi:MAG: hypothetical protein H6553_02870 [Chitinophagales bacterium]|nr:hypothetical protein [Chitinophagales bacterium]